MNEQSDRVDKEQSVCMAIVNLVTHAWHSTWSASLFCARSWVTHVHITPFSRPPRQLRTVLVERFQSSFGWPNLWFRLIDKKRFALFDCVVLKMTRYCGTCSCRYPSEHEHTVNRSSRCSSSICRRCTPRSLLSRHIFHLNLPANMWWKSYTRICNVRFLMSYANRHNSFFSVIHNHHFQLSSRLECELRVWRVELINI